MLTTDSAAFESCSHRAADTAVYGRTAGVIEGSPLTDRPEITEDLMESVDTSGGGVATWTCAGTDQSTGPYPGRP